MSTELVFCYMSMILLQVSHQVGSLMDLYTTFIELAGGNIPTDREVDGISLKDALLNNTVTDRFVNQQTIFIIRKLFFIIRKMFLLIVLISFVKKYHFFVF